MRVIVDANLIAALALPLPYSSQSSARIAGWKSGGVELHAPVLIEYELGSILRKAVAARLMTTDAATEAMRGFSALNIHCWAPTMALNEGALRWAERLGQSKAYDAHYLALAEELNCELWTADRRLARSAQQIGVGWIKWIGEIKEQESRA